MTDREICIANLNKLLRQPQDWTPATNYTLRHKPTGIEINTVHALKIEQRDASSSGYRPRFFTRIELRYLARKVRRWHKWRNVEQIPQWMSDKLLSFNAAQPRHIQPASPAISQATSTPAQIAYSVAYNKMLKAFAGK